MFHSVFVLSVLFVVVESQDGQDLKPQNLSLDWFTGFQPQLSWAPPLHSMGECTYTVSYQWNNWPIKSPWTGFIIMEGGSVDLTFKTECNGRESPHIELNIRHPELVSDLQCYVHAPEKTHCSWLPAHQAPDLKFFYRLNENFLPSVRLTADQINDSIRECPSYTFTDGIRTGCDLEAGTKHSIQILFNETVNNMLAWNTFEKSLGNDVRPPALKVTVAKIEDKFHVSWTRPDVEAYWKFKINHTVCGKSEIETADNKSTFRELHVIPTCPSCISVRAEKEYGTEDRGQTPWSEPKCFGAETDSYAYVFAAIIIPLMFAAMAVLAFVCCRKNKEIIFPKIPKPRDLISDIPDNNNKCNVHSLYVPAEEEDSCKITLVADPRNNDKLVATS